MNVNHLISDTIARIKNGFVGRKNTVSVLKSKQTSRIIEILEQEGQFACRLQTMQVVEDGVLMVAVTRLQGNHGLRAQTAMQNHHEEVMAQIFEFCCFAGVERRGHDRGHGRRAGCVRHRCARRSRRCLYGRYDTDDYDNRGLERGNDYCQRDDCQC